MTIQEMFDLLYSYRDAVTKLNNCTLYPITEEVKAVVKEEYELAKKVAEYLPRFTPMHCKHCRFFNKKCVSKNKTFGVDYCAFYDVI